MNRLFLLFVLSLSTAASMPNCLASNSSFSSNLFKAVEVANSRLAESKVKQGSVETLFVKRHSKPSNEILRENATDAYSLNLKTTLKNKVYWLVYYAPLSDGLGGDFAVFVEDKTWKVLGVYKGK